jgi:hypothetical protein
MKPPETKLSAAIVSVLMLVAVVATARGQGQFDPNTFFGGDAKTLGVVSFSKLFNARIGRMCHRQVSVGKLRAARSVRVREHAQ